MTADAPPFSSVASRPWTERRTQPSWLSLGCSLMVVPVPCRTKTAIASLSPAIVPTRMSGGRSGSALAMRGAGAGT